MTNLHSSPSLSSITPAPTAWKDTSHHWLVHSGFTCWSFYYYWLHYDIFPETCKLLNLGPWSLFMAHWWMHTCVKLHHRFTCKTYVPKQKRFFILSGPFRERNPCVWYLSERSRIGEADHNIWIHYPIWLSDNCTRLNQLVLTPWFPSISYLFKLEDHTSPYWLHNSWCSTFFSFFNVFQIQMRVACHLHKITKKN